MRTLRGNVNCVRRLPGQAGFTLLEVMFVTVGLAALVLCMARTTLGSARLGQEQEYRTRVLQLTCAFMERLKADENWADLYAYLRTREAYADTNPTGAVALTSGRRALPLHVYYSDIEVPDGLGDVAVLVQVPSSPPEGEPGGSPVLREDVTSALWGLPADLNGDGTIDGDPRDSDYVALPLMVTFFWQSVGKGTRETRRFVCLRGER